MYSDYTIVTEYIHPTAGWGIIYWLMQEIQCPCLIYNLSDLLKTKTTHSADGALKDGRHPSIQGDPDRSR